MDNQDLLKIAIKDLVKLSIKANDVIVKGSFPGSIADEVKEVLDMCNHVCSTFVEKEENNEE